jgi:NADPH2:quinone reductase
MEAAGTVDAVGPGIDHFKPGDRVAYAGGSPGAYAEVRNVPAANLLKIPDEVSDEDVAGVLLQGMTVQFLIRRIYSVKEGDTVLWHAAAGGVGLIACQWLKYLGVNVIGTVGSEEKAKLAKAHGCAHTILYRHDDVAKRVRELTNGEGVPVVFDSVGKDTWDCSLNSLRPFGFMISFGNASGAVPPVDIGQLAAKGSLYLNRPALGSYTSKRENLERASTELFDAMSKKVIKPFVSKVYSLKDAAQAHVDLQSRETTGSIILQP